MDTATMILLPEPKAQLIPQFPRATWSVDISFSYLKEWLRMSETDPPLNLEPDFQRAHVWTQEQQRKYIEFIFQGGESGKELLFNCPGWQDELRQIGPYVIVDGKQRLNAALAFLNDEFPVFGWKASQFDHINRLHIGFKWRVAQLRTQRKVLEWYLAINTGGTPHTEEELTKVRKMLKGT
jgi:hypothetical protein